MAHIYYSDNSSDNVTVIEDGTQIFHELFDKDYKRETSKIFSTASEKAKGAFFELMKFFAKPGQVNKIDTELLYIIDNTARRSNVFQYSVCMLAYNVNWPFLKELDIPIYDKQAFVDYIVVPLLKKGISRSDLRNLYKHVSRNLTKDNYIETLKNMYEVLNARASTYQSFINNTTIVKVYDKYLIDASILDDVKLLLKATRLSDFNIREWQTIDNVVKQIIECEDSRVRAKIVTDYISACDSGNMLLLLADKTSKIPSEWQVALATKGTIFENYTIQNIFRLLRYTYSDVKYLNELIAEAIRKCRSKSLNKFINDFIKKSEKNLQNPLTLEYFKDRLDYLSKEDLVPSFYIRRSWEIINKEEE